MRRRPATALALRRDIYLCNASYRGLLWPVAEPRFWPQQPSPILCNGPNVGDRAVTALFNVTNSTIYRVNFEGIRRCLHVLIPIGRLQSVIGLRPPSFFSTAPSGYTQVGFSCTLLTLPSVSSRFRLAVTHYLGRIRTATPVTRTMRNNTASATSHTTRTTCVSFNIFGFETAISLSMS